MTKSKKNIVVIPAKAGIQEGPASALKPLDSGFRRGDEVTVVSKL